MSAQVHWLAEGAPLFPWPETAQALLAELLTSTDFFCPLPSSLTVAAAPHAAWTAPMMAAFEAAAASGPLPARLAVRCNAMTEHTGAFTGPSHTEDGSARLYDIFLCAPGQDIPGLEALRAQSHTVLVTAACETLPLRTAGFGPPPHCIMLPQTACWAAHITHWAHMLWLAQGVPCAWRGPGAGNVLGEGVRIHRTARVENSVLMAGVEVDAHATVVGSWLGPGARVADHTAVHHSVMAAHVHTLADSLFQRVVALPGSTLSNVGIRDVVLGRGVFLTAGVIFFGGIAGRNAPVGQSPAELQDSGHAELGGAVGHGCVLGARALFEPGRALPGGVVIVMRPEEGVTKMPPDSVAPAPVCWHQGALVPVAQVQPGYRPPELED